MSRSVNPSEPASEPLTLNQAKQHLGISLNDPFHDALIADLITASRQIWEHDTQWLTSSRSVVEQLSGWPGAGWRFYYPLESVTTITYYDTDNNQQTLNSDQYSVDAPNRMIYPAPDVTWPEVYLRWDAVSITYLAGTTVPVQSSSSAIRLKLDDLFESRGLAPNQMREHVSKSYEAMVRKFGRSTYP